MIEMGIVLDSFRSSTPKLHTVNNAAEVLLRLILWSNDKV